MNNLARQVLLIASSGSIAEHVQASLSNGGAFDLQWSKDLTSGLNRLSTSAFDAVVLELSLPDSSSTDALIAVRRAFPDIPVVVLGDDQNPSQALQAISEGAQDYLTTTTWNPASLPRILTYAIERHRSGRPSVKAKNGKLLTFIGAKGGVGTTTVALNTAAALASPDHVTIATEWCWPRGNFSLYLAEPPARNLSAVGTLQPRAITTSALQQLLSSTSNNLMVLHGPQTAAEFHFLNQSQAEALVTSLLQIADFAVMDLAPYPSTVGRVAIQNSSTVVVVLEPNPTSVVLANEVLSMVGSSAGGVAVAAVLVNKGGSASVMAIEEIRSQLRCGIVGVVPPSTEPVPGFFRGIPVTISRQGTLAGESLTEIARQLTRKQLELKP